MRRVAALLLLVAASLWARGADELPPCPPPDDTKQQDFGWSGRTWHWNACRGEYVILRNKELRGTVVKGEWRAGQPDGQGSYLKPDGEQYAGGLRSTQKHGYGELIFPHGDRYVGEFKADQYHGEGIYLYANGDVHVGSYQNGWRHGRGSYTFANGASYIGEFSEDRFHGQGAYVFADGDKYAGEFRDGKRDGVGSYVTAEGDKYIGEFKDDLMDGYGSYQFASGAKYVGGFRHGQFHGEGVFITADGRRTEALWEDNQLVREIDSSEANALSQQELEEERRQLADERRQLEEARRDFEATRDRDKPPARASDDDEPRTVAGSGFIITTDGYIVTNYHVVEGRTEVTVRTIDGKTYDASIVRLDDQHDLALLKIRANGLASVPIGESANIKRGTAVLVGGFPQVMVQGMEPKITDGIISSLTGIMDDATVFQMSNPIQPGNSGGPLFTLDGNVIGIVSAKLSDKVMLREFDSIPQNVNFAVKSSYLLELLKEIRSVRLPPPNPKRKYRATEDVVGAVEPALVLIIAR